MRWAQIPGYCAYEISSRGDVRRSVGAKPGGVGHKKRPGELLKPTGKYHSYSLVDDTGKINAHLRVSRLMLVTYVGPPPTPRHLALHWDDNQDNNVITNLRWGTHKDNGVDKIRNGNSLTGTKNHAARLTDDKVLAMRRDYASGASLKDLCQKYGLTIMPIWAAVIGRSWKHLPGAVPQRGQGRKIARREI